MAENTRGNATTAAGRPVVTADAALRITDASAAALQWFGKPHEALLGQQLCALVECRDAAGHARRAPACAALAGENDYGCCEAFGLIERRGEAVMIDLGYLPLQCGQQLIGLAGVPQAGPAAGFDAGGGSARRARALREVSRLLAEQAPASDATFAQVSRCAADALGVKLAGVFEFAHAGRPPRLRAGVGWLPGACEVPLLPGAEASGGHSGWRLLQQARFEVSPLLLRHGVAGGISLLIGPASRPFGLLGAYTAARRRFTAEEIDCAAAIANLLALLLPRAQRQQALAYGDGVPRPAAREWRAAPDRRAARQGVLQDYLDALGKAGQLLRDQQFALDQHSIVAVTDQAGRITYANDKFCAISQYSREELLGQNHRLLQSDYHPPDFFRDMWRTIARGQVWKGEVRNRSKQGGYYWVDTTIVPFLDERGKPYQYVAIRTDITQRKRDEEELKQARDAALEASRMKSEFLATMSHEIRTPMNGVLGMVELLLDTALDAQQRQQANTILDSANSLLHIINDILDFSKIEAGRMTLEEENFVLADVVEGVADILAPKARRKNLALMTRIDAAAPGVLHGDAGRLRQVLLNLASNAVKFTDSGDIVLAVAVEAVQQSSTLLRFSVSDSGIGIAPEQAARLFHPFTQADSSTTRRYGGTGLGLSISKRLVELMGGEIGLDSRTGAGSTFWFTLPLKTSGCAAPADSAPGGAELTGARVLVVDDSEANREVLRHYLQTWGADCTLASDGPQALALMRAAAACQAGFALALIDLAMPGMDGFTLAQQIQADAALAACRLVMMTASDDIGQGSKAMRRGFKAYFNKPIRRAHLFEGLSRVMRGEENTPAPPAPAPLAAVELAGAPQVLLPGIKPVLLVEDNAVNQAVAKLQLERLGFLVRLAGNGSEALKLIQQEEFSLVLMDCQMPQMDGYEAATRIRQWEARQQRPPIVIVALTANAVQGDSERCLAAGMNDYLAKPVRMERLQQMLAKWHILPGLRRGHASPQEAADSMDGAVLDRLREEIGESASEIVNSYLATTPELLDNLARAFAARDFDEVRIFAHTLKSSSLQLGLIRLGDLAHRIEMRAQADPAAFEADAMGPLIDEFHRASQALQGRAAPVSLPRLRANPKLALVLVVDDDVTMRLMLRRAMENDGYEVEEAVNGTQAVSKCEALQPDIVLMDCLMPGMSGFDACAMLQHRPEKRRPPVLMITGLNDEVSVQRAIQCGAADFISKPLYVPILRQRVRQLLDMRRAQDHIRHLAYHDTLTGLPNRVLFNDRLQHAIAAAQRSGQRLAVMFLDLDNFKNVNDSLGHAAGDVLLKSVAERVSAILREEDTLSRMGGDEFTLLLPRLAAGDDGLRGTGVLADKIIRSLNAPFHVGGQEIYIGISIGISVYPDDSADASGLLKNADAAMYWAKSAGRNGFCLYSTAMHEQATERLQLESCLRKALERDELVVYYQPQINTSSERMVGMEALLRWHHPELGMVPPAKFIPLAEDSGLIIDIGTWVIRAACAQCKIWHERGYAGLSVAVNLSVRQFRSGNLVEVVRAALEETGLPPPALDLEITESITMQDSEEVRATLHQLKALGVLISMDDFGTGYSSLSNLKSFPIDVLKIDQSFVRDIISDPNDAAIVETVIAMAQTLGMRVVAEGVETAEQLEFLRDKGCEVVQGYLISRPHPAEHFDALLK